MNFYVVVLCSYPASPDNFKESLFGLIERSKWQGSSDEIVLAVF